MTSLKKLIQRCVDYRFLKHAFLLIVSMIFLRHREERSLQFSVRLGNLGHCELLAFRNVG